jgi:prolyl 4-hydroxylase
VQYPRYQVGEEYRPHFDWFDEFNKNEKVHGGQRFSTFLIYLHTPEDGGATTFPRAGISVPAIKGNAILFYNVDENGENDNRALHSSEIVQEGTKWVVVKWLREKSRGYN